jgi:hypothetical protein
MIRSSCYRIPYWNCAECPALSPHICSDSPFSITQNVHSGRLLTSTDALIHRSLTFTLTPLCQAFALLVPGPGQPVLFLLSPNGRGRLSICHRTQKRPLTRTSRLTRTAYL